MSAYIVSHNTLNALLSFGAFQRDPLHIYFGEAPALCFDNPLDLQRAAEILLAENYRSVNTRYAGRVEPPAPITFRYDHTPAHLDPVQVLKLCDCYEYQACETPDYRDTHATRIVNFIRAAATAALPGWRQAKWGLDE